MSQAPIFPTKATPARMMDSLEIKFKVAVKNHQIPSQDITTDKPKPRLR